MTVVLVGFVVLCVFWAAVKEFMIAQERSEWRSERRELMTRIQHPEVVISEPVERDVELAEPDEINLVGAVVE